MPRRGAARAKVRRWDQVGYVVGWWEQEPGPGRKEMVPAVTGNTF